MEMMEMMEVMEMMEMMEFHVHLPHEWLALKSEAPGIL
jgi:hypothetical protein